MNYFFPLMLPASEGLNLENLLVCSRFESREPSSLKENPINDLGTEPHLTICFWFSW